MRELQYAIEIGGFALALLLVIALHELGHLLAVTLCGLRWQELAVGPLVLRRAGNLGIRREWRWSWLIGHVLYVADRKTTRAQELFVALSGAGANLITFFVVGGLATWLHVPDRSWLSHWLPLVGTFSLLTAIGNLIPLRIQGGRIESDGLRVWNLLRR